ncbi:MAG TPA: PAS domain-containing protein [Rhizomicrobium sp.]|jgi:hypothetical protein
MMPVITEMLARTSGPPVEFDRSVSLTREMTAKAYEYWKAARGTRAMPARKDITPQTMRDFVQHVGLVEVRKMADGRATYFIRLAGSRIEHTFGAITGKTLSEFLPAQLEARWRLVFDAAREMKAPVRIASRLAFEGKSYLAAEVLLAPLGESDDVSMLFAGVDIWPAEPPPPGKPARA